MSVPDGWVLTPDNPELRWFRIEASVPAIQRVQARTAEEAITLACEDRDAWDVDLDAPIEAEHVESCEEDE